MKDLIQKILKTKNSYTLLFMRVILAVVIFPHGAQKLFGWFGGGGFEGTMNGFVQSGIPAFLAFLVIVFESVGTVSLFAGFLSRLNALAIGVIMLVAALTRTNGFFMNWRGNQTGEGFEFHLLAMGLAFALTIKGGGAFSVDRILMKKEKKEI